MQKFGLILLNLFVLVGCQSQPSGSSFGELNTKYLGYIPVRTSVLSCLDLTDVGASQASEQLVAALRQEVCRLYDQFVLDGFKNQKFMRGYTPNAVEKFYKRTARLNPASRDHQKNFMTFLSSQLRTLRGLDSHQGSSSDLKLGEQWQEPLLEFSLDVGNSDALFLPVLTEIGTKKTSVQGEEVLRVQVHLHSILIDTTRNAVVWHSKIERFFYSKNLSSLENTNKQLDPSTLSKVFADLFLDHHWMSYPGRISI